MKDLGSDAVMDFNAYELGNARRYARSMGWAGMQESLIQHLPSVRIFSSASVGLSNAQYFTDFPCGIVCPRPNRHPTSSERIHSDDSRLERDSQLGHRHGLSGYITH